MKAFQFNSILIFESSDLFSVIIARNYDTMVYIFEMIKDEGKKII